MHLPHLKKTISAVILLALLAGCSFPAGLAEIVPALHTPTLTPTATPLPTSTPLPSPTPLPLTELHFGETNLFTGEYEAAIEDFKRARDEAQDDETRAAGTLGISRIYFLRGTYPLAVNLFKAVIESYPQTRSAADAWYYLAETYVLLEAYTQAGDAFTQYLALRPQPIAGYVQVQRGDAYLAGGDAQTAAAAYQAALEDPPLGNPVWIELKLARAWLRAESNTEAATLLLSVLEKSDNDYARSQANLLLGGMYKSLGEDEQAYARYQHSVTNYPKSYDTYTQLVELVNANQPVNALQRGMIDYYAGEYGYCIEALTKAIEQNLEPRSAGFYFRGLCYRASNQAEAALADFQFVQANLKGDVYWGSAIDEAAYTQWAWLDQYDAASQTLLNYVAAAGDAADAPVKYFNAARVLERGESLAAAAQVWQDLATAYPAAAESLEALIQAGVSYYRLQDYVSARTVFQKALVLTDLPDVQSRALLWLGKAENALGDAAKARENWALAAQKDPTGYYSTRAAELHAGGTPFTIAEPYDVGYDLNKEKGLAEDWLRSRFEIPGDADLASLGSLVEESGIRRGEELYRLGRYAEARNEFEEVRQKFAADPLNTYRLMNFFLERSLYRQAILSSRQVLDLAGMDDAGTLNAPRYFNHIRFGFYFKPLVLKAAQAEDLPPLLLLSVIRQESLFESIAESGAGARGLMQIIPTTGAELASQMHWPEDYVTSDLDRPVVNIAYGARYLRRQQDGFGGSLYAALAAYNGGPGNTLVWHDLAGDDPDLFLEVVRLSETTTYIKQIYMFFNLYKLIYSSRP